MGVTASGDHQATHGTHAKLMVCSADASASRRSCCSAVAFLATHLALCVGSRRRSARLVVRMPAVSWTASDMLGGSRRCCSVCSAALILSMLRSQRLHDEPSEWPRCLPQRALLATTRCVQTRYRAGRPHRSTLAVSAVSASGGVQLLALCTLRGTMHICIFYV